MKPVLPIFFSLIIVFCFSQQTEETFIVRKRVVGEKRGFPKVFDLKLGPVSDTICGGVMLDISSAQGYYDSVSLFNLKKYKEPFGTNRYFYDATTKSGHAIITFYKKEKNGSYKMVYFRNWVIHCLDKYSR